MNFLVKLILTAGVIGGAGAATYQPALKYWAERNRVQWETTEIITGDITRYVNSTGTIEPVLKISVGSFVSGPIVELNVDFNDEVQKGDVLARIDPQLFRALLDRDEATLESRKAELERVEAQLQQAINNFQRGQKLRQSNRDYLSEQEMDALTFEVRSLEAQRRLAKASIAEVLASMQTSKANLRYCDITAPVDGMVIDRLIDPGQTLAAQFQTPELFIVAPDLRKKVHVFASVDEADIGLIQRAQKEERPVTFTVDAHPDEVFHGTIEQLRVSSVATQNVVTYPVVIAAKNPDLKLLPGMTASISFEVDATTDVPKIPNAALRFFPDDIKLVREQDRGLIDGSTWKTQATDDDDSVSATEKVASQKDRNKRHVWVQDGEFLRAVEIRTGLTENRFTELQTGELKAGDQLVVGKKT